MTDPPPPSRRARFVQCLLRWRLLFLPAAALSLTADLWSKHVVYRSFGCGLEHVQFFETAQGDRVPHHVPHPLCERPIIEGVFNLRAEWNPGAAFSLFSGSTGFLLVVGALALVLLAYLLFTSPRGWLIPSALGFVFGGAIGNLHDRFSFTLVSPEGTQVGLVRDFFLLVPKIPIYDHPWPVFNVADIAIVVGVALMLWDLILQRRRERRAERELSAEDRPDSSTT